LKQHQSPSVNVHATNTKMLAGIQSYPALYFVPNIKIVDLLLFRAMNYPIIRMSTIRILL
jgi:hypothetical protein